MNQTLTIIQKADLKKLTITIDKAASAWADAVPALIQIREQKLYRDEAKTFEDFCQKRWGWTRRWVNQQIESSKTIKMLPVKLGTMVPTERAARALTEVPKSQRSAVVQSIVDKGEKVTTATIQQAAKAASPPKPPTPLDHQGTKVPAPAIPFWERRDEVQDMLTELSQMKCSIEEKLKDGDSLYVRVAQDVIAHLSQAYSSLSDAKLYAVCTDCQGWFDKGPQPCGTCHGTGLISKYRFEHCSRKEVKDMRKAANQSRA